MYWMVHLDYPISLITKIQIYFVPYNKPINYSDLGRFINDLIIHLYWKYFATIIIKINIVIIIGKTYFSFLSIL